MNRAGKPQNYYDVLDVSLNANHESIRTAYIRAKNAYNRDSLATYSLFDPEESKEFLDQIEEAYSILSDAEKRQKYDEAHGFLSSESSGGVLVEAPARTEDENQVEERLRSAARSESFIPLRGSYQITKAHALDPVMEEKIRSTENITGSFLKSVREYKQVSQEEIIDFLKISKNYLLALESDDFGKLPATVFVRGFIIQYAKALKLDPEKIVNSYMRFLKTNRL